MPLVWLDALTPKQARLMASIALKLEKKGYEFFITTRDYDYTVSVLREVYGIEPIVVGSHGSTLYEKLVLDAERVKTLARIVEEKKPCLLISYPSPSAVRAAFGLAIKIVLLSDSPHIAPVHRLTFPLADHVVVSEYIAEAMKKYILPGFTSFTTYRGVDEAEYLKSFRPNKHPLDALGLEPYQYIVVRPPEYKAVYYPKGHAEGMVEKLVVELLKKEDVKAVYFPRYPEQKELMSKIRGVIIPPRAYDSLPLLYHAVAVVTGGISMAREAALLGTPAYSLFAKVLDIDKYLISVGVPLKYVEDYNQLYGELVGLVKDVKGKTLGEIETKRREGIKTILDSMEQPSSKISVLVEKYCG